MLTPLVPLHQPVFCRLLLSVCVCVCRCLSGNKGRPILHSMHPLFSGAAAKARYLKGTRLLASALRAPLVKKEWQRSTERLDLVPDIS